MAIPINGIDPNQPFIIIDRVGSSDEALILAVIFGPLCWITVAVRLYTRAFLLKRVGWDDYMMVVALLFFSVYAAGFVYTQHIVKGHQSLNIGEFKDSYEWLLVTFDFYVLTAIVLKISLAIFFLRLMVLPLQRRIVYATITLSTTVGTAYFFFSVFQCGYFTSIMEFGIRRSAHRRCASSPAVAGISYTAAAVSALVDWVFALLPITMIRTARMLPREKTTVIVILAMASIGSVASIVRIRYIHVLTQLESRFWKESMPLGSWSLIELALGITAASLATLRPLLRRFLKPIRSMYERTPDGSHALAASGERHVRSGARSRSLALIHGMSAAARMPYVAGVLPEPSPDFADEHWEKHYVAESFGDSESSLGAVAYPTPALPQMTTRYWEESIAEEERDMVDVDVDVEMARRSRPGRALVR